MRCAGSTGMCELMIAPTPLSRISFPIDAGRSTGTIVVIDTSEMLDLKIRLGMTRFLNFSGLNIGSSMNAVLNASIHLLYPAAALYPLLPTPFSCFQNSWIDLRFLKPRWANLICEIADGVGLGKRSDPIVES